MVEYEGAQYYSDGHIEHVGGRQPLCEVAPEARGRNRMISLCNSSTPDPNDSITVYWGFSFSNCTSSSVQFGLTQPTYGVEPKIGPIYNSDRPVTDCTNPIPDAKEVAEKAAEYVVGNAGQFPSYVVAAASNALEDWENTGLGVAASATAAMEFLSFLGIALSPLDFLIILAAIGFTIFTAIEIVKCLKGQ